MVARRLRHRIHSPSIGSMYRVLSDSGVWTKTKVSFSDKLSQFSRDSYEILQPFLLGRLAASLKTPVSISKGRPFHM